MLIQINVKLFQMLTLMVLHLTMTLSQGQGQNGILTNKPSNPTNSPTTLPTLKPTNKLTEPADKTSTTPTTSASTASASTTPTTATKSTASPTTPTTTATTPPTTTQTTTRTTSPTTTPTTTPTTPTTTKPSSSTKKTGDDGSNVANSQDPVLCGQPVILNQYGNCGDPVINRIPVGSGAAVPDYGDVQNRLDEAEREVALLESQLSELLGIKERQRPGRNKDCYDIYKHNNIHLDGVYELIPDDGPGFEVLCIFDQNNGEADKWTVIQHHINDNVSFSRTWAEYKYGFGVLSPMRSFWLGLEKLHRMTTQRQYTLRIDIEKWGEETRYAQYNSFRVRSEKEKYSLFYADYSGTAGDALGEYHLNMNFTTLDEDNDEHPELNCAEAHGGGWWYNKCDHANPNGPFSTIRQLSLVNDQGMEWDTWDTGYSYSAFIMRIKPTFTDQL